jgi:hypothetical protein
VSKLVQEFEIMAAFFKIEYPTLLNTMQATAENQEIDRNTDSKDSDEDEVNDDPINEAGSSQECQNHGCGTVVVVLKFLEGEGERLEMDRYGGVVMSEFDV